MKISLATFVLFFLSKVAIAALLFKSLLTTHDRTKIIKTFQKNQLIYKNYSVTNVTFFCEIFASVYKYKLVSIYIYLHLGQTFFRPHHSSITNLLHIDGSSIRYPMTWKVSRLDLLNANTYIHTHVFAKRIINIMMIATHYIIWVHVLS